MTAALTSFQTDPLPCIRPRPVKKGLCGGLQPEPLRIEFVCGENGFGISGRRSCPEICSKPGSFQQLKKYILLCSDSESK
jgi:hypothetical protein